MEVTYGYDLKGGETFVTSTKRAAEIFMSASTLKVFALCTAFPYDAVKTLPAWFPGMGWKSEAAECRRLVSDGLNTPFTWTKRRVVRPEINTHVRLCGQWGMQGTRECNAVHGR